MNKYRKKRTVWGYCRLVTLSIGITVVGILVIGAILSQSDWKILMYAAVFGIVFLVIGLKK